jgi:hypothetical protein
MKNLLDSCQGFPRVELGTFGLAFQGSPDFRRRQAGGSVAAWPRRGRLIEGRIERWFSGADHGRSGARGCWYKEGGVIGLTAVDPGVGQLPQGLL